MQSWMNQIQNSMYNAVANAAGAQRGGMQFKETYRCFPAAMHPNEAMKSLEGGDKILLPSSALATLSQLLVAYPMLFELHNPKIPGLKGHCGVREFSSQEGHVYMPHWLMENLCLNAGDIIEVTNVSLPKGKFVQLRPHKSAFVELANPKAILERALRNFTCLSKGSSITIQYDTFGSYKLDVVDLKPADAVSIVEADVNVDFLPPKDAEDGLSSSVSRPPTGGSAPSVTKESSSAGSSKAEAPSSSSTKPSVPFGGDERINHLAAEDEEKKPAVAPAKTSSSGSSYFAKLGKGNRLDSKSSSSSSGVTSGTSSSSAAASRLPPYRSQHSSSGRTAGGFNSSTTAIKKRVVEESNGFRYIYEIDPKTEKKRLIRRERIPKNAYFQSKGHKLVKRKKK